MEATLDAPASTYVDVMTDCECLPVAVDFLDFPEGKSKYLGGVRDILACPPGLENKSLDVLLPFTIAKKKFFKRDACAPERADSRTGHGCRCRCGSSSAVCSCCYTTVTYGMLSESRLLQIYSGDCLATRRVVTNPLRRDCCYSIN